MTTVTDSEIFKNIFSTPESSAIWSDRTRTAYYLQFESALAVAEARVGIIPQEAATLIEEKCSSADLIDMKELREETEKIGYPVLGVVKQIVRMVNDVKPGLGEWTHWGQRLRRSGSEYGQDVTDTATILQLRDSCNLFWGQIASSMITWMTFGFNMARASQATFERSTCQRDFSDITSRLYVLEFGGAAGTLATV
ncbi:hypothetical protein K435DRAFT_897327 [Dendrothele bispora CBS 962.96]|uniref:Uncharacterized protein n=1 Tax=Dendrothele bispora (strain CBS 962.96) TaxID=1314807 RepID=A0A4S8MQ04_DENBC|nr:hypothetical protein K435DRAFT_897327 [Dendrothele bispora CBS 962.96]